MSTTKTNPAPKKTTTTTKKAVVKQLDKEATGQAPKPITKTNMTPPVNLDARMQAFEQLRGLANKRERLVKTLGELTRFNYNLGDASFTLTDTGGLSFKTNNTNLITLVTSTLQDILTQRKEEIEAKITAFEL